jgi:hypothetical protein
MNGAPRSTSSSGSVATFVQLVDAWPRLAGDAAPTVHIVGLDYRGVLHLAVWPGATLPLDQFAAQLQPRLPASVDGVAVRRIEFHRRPSVATAAVRR